MGKEVKIMSTFDCRRCGACCRGQIGVDAQGLETDEDEVAKLLDLENTRHELQHHAPGKIRVAYGVMRLKDNGDCIALKEDHGIWTCTIYDHRPTICREFEVGGEWCLVAAARTWPVPRPRMEV